MIIGDTTDLHYLGNYERELPVSLHRMIENAYDWAHLPFVHPGAFAEIELIDCPPSAFDRKIGCIK